MILLYELMQGKDWDNGSVNFWREGDESRKIPSTEAARRGQGSKEEHSESEEAAML